MLVAGFTGSEDDMQATAPEITIRIARDDEARACRILLPEMFPADQMPDLLTAISDDAAGPHFAGALAMSAVNCPREPGFTFLLHVVPSFRRQGIGRGLLAEAIRLAVEGVCSNIIRHGYPAGQPGPIRLEVRDRPDRWEVVIEDRAAPFDPATVPAPDLTLDWEDRPLGGQGWHLVRNVVDLCHYARIAGPGNRVTLVKAKSKERR